MKQADDYGRRYNKHVIRVFRAFIAKLIEYDPEDIRQTFVRMSEKTGKSRDEIASILIRRADEGFDIEGGIPYERHDD